MWGPRAPGRQEGTIAWLFPAPPPSSPGTVSSAKGGNPRGCPPSPALTCMALTGAKNLEVFSRPRRCDSTCSDGRARAPPAPFSPRPRHGSGVTDPVSTGRQEECGPEGGTEGLLCAEARPRAGRAGGASGGEGTYVVLSAIKNY